ncbi:MAG: hypothetical protein Q7K03_11760 [Dehalococcoidia bacterium]|nr:hypothetical protein [Dehalococcoidia bacterium]
MSKALIGLVKKLKTAALFLGLVVLAFIAVMALLLMAVQIGITEKVLGVQYFQLSLTIVLAFATLWYAWRTDGLVKATEASVAEMKKQRQDTFLPVLDILDTLGVAEGLEIHLGLKEGKMPISLTCKLRNVGVGPALYVQYPVLWDKGTKMLTEDCLPQGSDLTPPAKLAIVSSAAPPYVQVSYRDVFGRQCTSTKAVLADPKKETFQLGPLQTQFGN